MLRKSGHDVISISDDYPGISDSEVINKSISNNLIILTFDKDYGEIIFKNAKRSPPAVVFFRFKGTNPINAGEILLDLLENDKLDIENKFTVIEENNIRQRTYNK